MLIVTLVVAVSESVSVYVTVYAQEVDAETSIAPVELLIDKPPVEL